MAKGKKDDMISILMPTYNVAKYVEEAVKSILQQTYRDFELIIVDDCSTDGTYEILSKLAESDKRIVLSRNEVNSKICVTLNKAWQRARGEFIGRMDGDDISAPERFEVLKRFLDEHQDIDLVGSQAISIDENGNKLSYKKYLRTPAFIRRGNHFCSSISHIWLAKRKVYETLKGYRNIPYAEDYDFLLRGENRGFLFANVEEYVYSIRIRQGNTGFSEGLNQFKTKYYVQAINQGKVPYTEETYKKAISYTPKEQKEFIVAYNALNKAINEREKKFMLIWHTVDGCLYSKYVLKYVIEASIIRLLILLEDIIKPHCKK